MQENFAPLFMPKTVAVVGASAKGTALPNVFIRRIKEYGFTGEIYPIHPSAATIDGIPAYPNLAATPKPVDYAYIAVSGAQIPDMLKVAAGRVRFAQVISSGFGEVDVGLGLERIGDHIGRVGLLHHRVEVDRRPSVAVRRGVGQVVGRDLDLARKRSLLRQRQE